jgi:hypothetical protein
MEANESNGRVPEMPSFMRMSTLNYSALEIKQIERGGLVTEEESSSIQRGSFVELDLFKFQVSNSRSPTRARSTLAINASGLVEIAVRFVATGYTG